MRWSSSAVGQRVRLLLVAGLLLGLLAGCEVPGAALSGHLLVAGSAEPAAGVPVTVFSATSEVAVGETVANQDGVYSFPRSALPGGTYRVRFGSSEWWEGAADWVSATDVVITVGATLVVNAEVTPATGALAGTVSDDTAGIEDVTVQALSVVNGALVATTSTGADGRYAFGALAAGRYWLRFQAPGRATSYLGGPTKATATAVEVVATQATAAPALVLPAESIVAGRATRAGEPAGGVLVHARLDDPAEPWFIAMTDADGSFALTGLPAADFVVGLVDLSGGATAGVTINDGADPPSPLVFSPDEGEVIDVGDVDLTTGQLLTAPPRSTWYEPGLFIDWSGVGIVAELFGELGGGGMHAVGPWQPFAQSTSLDDFMNRLATDVRLHAKLTLARNLGSPMIVQLEMMPSWLTSAPGNASLPCSDQPLWPTWATRAPAADKWDEWEELIEETVRYLTVTRGYDHLWFQLWEEPEGPCFWTDTEANYLELYVRTARAVKRANPDARIGGPGSTEPAGAIEPSTRPLVQALVEHAASADAPLDFVSYHYFGFTPHRAKLVGEEVGGWLDDAGYPDAPILISSFNPLESAVSPYWPNPGTPSPTGRTWEYDTEIGAAYVPALSYAMAQSGRHGYLTLFQLDDFDGGREYESDAAWGARTPEERNGIRKAIYQAMRLMSQVPDTPVATAVVDPRAGSDGALGPLGALAGVEGDSVSLLLWSYVAGPGQEANAVVMADGYPGGLATWDLAALAPYFLDLAPVSSVSSDPQEQVTIAKAKRVFFRQRELVDLPRSVRICGEGLTTPQAVHVVDATHNNSYAAWQTGGLSAAIAAGQLTTSPEALVADGDCWRTVLSPYAVVGVRFGATSVPDELLVEATDGP